MHNFQANYDKIPKVLNELDCKMDYLNQIRKPKLSDKKLIPIDLKSEYMGIDSECQLFRILPAGLSGHQEHRKKMDSTPAQLDPDHTAILY